jgi:hypothetical protein
MWPIHSVRTSGKLISLLYRRIGVKEKFIIFTKALVVVIVLGKLMPNQYLIKAVSRQLSAISSWLFGLRFRFPLRPLEI